MASVSLNSVYKAFGDTVISSDINLDIDEGEFVVFVGPSGCGKSTLLRMIAGLEDITSGELKIGDKRMNEVPPAERGIGMVFQSYALYPHLSVAENMSFGLKLAGAKKAEINQRVNQVSEVLQLAHLLDRRPKALSGGQRQRVAIGRTLVAEPTVFLLDEPLSNLDAALRVQMRIEISRLHKRLKRTMIYVTHDQVEAMTLADRIVVLNQGNIEQIGTPVELYNHPASLFVAGFIGTPKINVIPAQVVGRQLWVNGQPVFPLGDKFPAAQDGQTVSLAIRPELLRLEEATDHAFDVVVDFTELQGDSTLVYATFGEHALKMKSSKQLSFPRHTALRFGFNAASVLLFDAQGKRIPQAMA